MSHATAVVLLEQASAFENPWFGCFEEAVLRCYSFAIGPGPVRGRYCQLASTLESINAQQVRVRRRVRFQVTLKLAGYLTFRVLVGLVNE